MSETKESILAKAVQLFLRKSYEGVSIQNIAQEVGLTKSSLYHHFPKGKEQIFREGVEGFFQKFFTNFELLPQDSLQKFYRAFLEEQRNAVQALALVLPPIHQEKRDLGKINLYSMFWDAFRNFPEFRIRVDEHFHREELVWRTVVERAQERGEVRADIDPLRGARLFTAVLVGVGNAMLWDAYETTYLEEAEALWDELYGTLRAQDGTPETEGCGK